MIDVQDLYLQESSLLFVRSLGLLHVNIFIINSSHGYVVTFIKGRFSALVLLKDPATVANTIDGVESIVAA